MTASERLRIINLRTTEIAQHGLASDERNNAKEPMSNAQHLLKTLRLRKACELRFL